MDDRDSVRQPPGGGPALPWRDDKSQMSDADKLLASTENMRRAEEKKEERLRLKASGFRVDLGFRTPQDILRKPVTQPFSFDDVPRPLGEFAYYQSQASGFDPSGVIVASVIAAASMINDGFRLAVRPESNWYESARLWAVLIGTPSAGKSPSIRAATDIIKDIHRAEFLCWKLENADKPKEERTSLTSLYVSDTTIAALGEVLKDNPQGLLMLTEEFSSWIGAIDAADRGEAARNRGNWLELWDGGPRQIGRIERGQIFIPNWGVSVLAACTPDGLRQHMKQLPEDGLIHRFIPVVMGPPNLDPTGDARAAIEAWARLIRRLRDIKPERVEMSPEARALFLAEERYKRYLVDAIYDTSPTLASHLGKHPGILARAALTFHACTYFQHPVVQPDTMIQAIRFTRHISRHANVLFNHILATSPALALARALARSLAAGGSLTTIGRAWMSDHCAEFKRADDSVRMEAVHLLEDADWIEPTIGMKAYRGWPREWQVNSTIPYYFGKEGEAWQARRAAVKEAIGLNDE